MTRFKLQSRTSGLLGLAALAGLVCSTLALTPSRGQDANNEWRVDPIRGPVDLGLTDPSLVGAIDVHLHVDPEFALRETNAKFRRRFAAMEGASETPLEELPPESLEKLWDGAKEKERSTK